jgi:hypothetical protein
LSSAVLPPSRSLIDSFRADLVETDECAALCTATWQIGFRENLWAEICSEFDARRLAEYVHGVHLPLSGEFRTFETGWLRDEHNHYTGFRQLYSTMYRVPTGDLISRVETRRSHFGAMSRFLTDEFRLCVLLAYDEEVTARAYARDFPMYDALGDRAVSAWIRHVCRDESNHGRHAVDILRNRYPHRLADVPRVLDELVGSDPGSSDYEGSFVLDHQSYPDDLIERGRRAVLTLCRSGR